MQAITGMAEVNGTKLYYEQLGEGHPLILLNGFMAHVRMWDDQFEVFAKHYKVIRYDLRGFGRSALPKEAYSHIEDLRSLLDYLAVEKAIFVGQSMGGGIAVDFTIEYPKRAAVLILVDSVLGGFQHSEEYYQEGKTLFSNAVNEGVSRAMQRVFDDPPTFFAAAFKNDALKKRIVEILSSYSGFHLINADPQTPLDPPAIDRLSEIHAPTLAIVGELDAPDYHKIADTLVSRINGSEQVMITGGGHLINMEKPAEFNEVVLNFLRRVGSE